MENENISDNNIPVRKRRISGRKKTIFALFCLIFSAALISVVIFIFINKQKVFSSELNMEQDPSAGQDMAQGETITPTPEPTVIKREKPAEKEIYGLYLTSYSASSIVKIDSILAQIKGSAINAVIIDIKDYSGQIAYDSQIPLVNELQNDRNLIKNLPDLITKLHDNGLYVIARQTVFQDPELTNKKPEWAVQSSATGTIWKDYKGLSWADQSKEEVWAYNLAIAKEAISLGFDEVNFDYIRFPSDGPMSTMIFSNMNGRTKAQVMASFFKYLYDNLKDEPAYISADLFGFTTERTDDMNIGQQIEDAALYFDYVCPMVYPSHYPPGYLNLDNPADHPYEVITHAMAKGYESLHPKPTEPIIPEQSDANVNQPEATPAPTIVPVNYRAKIRPWLQAFNMGAIYDADKINLQIKASNENGGYGYLLWNARNVYGYLPKS